MKQLHVGGGLGVEGEECLHPLTTRRAHPRAEGGIAEQLADLRGNEFGPARRNKQAGFAIGNDFRDAANRRRHNWHRRAR